MSQVTTKPHRLNVSLRTIAKGASIVFIGGLVGRLIGYCSRIIIARFLGVSGYGMISLGFALMTIIVMFASLGMSSGIVRSISFYKGKGDEGRIKGTIISAIKMTLATSIFFALLLFFGAGWISTYIFHDATLTPIFKVFAVGVPFLVLTQNLLSATVGFQKIRYKVYAENIIKEILKLCGILTFVTLGFGIVGIAIGWVLAIVLMPFVAFYFLQKKVFQIFNSKIKAIPMEKELFSFSTPLIFVGMASVLMGFTDTLMLGHFCTSYEVGIYNAALPIAMSVRIPSGALTSLFMPVITGLHAQGQYDTLKSTYRTVVKWVVMLGFPIALFISLFSNEIIQTLFGTEYVIGSTALIILTFGFFIGSVLGVSHHIIISFGKTKTFMRCYFVGAAMNFCLNMLLIPTFGINGAALATMISFIFVQALFYRIATQTLCEIKSRYKL